MAGRNMGRFPVIFSLVVTKLSAIAIIGEPADIYLFGTQRCIGFVFIFIGCAVTAYVFLPVYFAVGASTIYEVDDFLESKNIKRMQCPSHSSDLNPIGHVWETSYSPSVPAKLYSRIEKNDCRGVATAVSMIRGPKLQGTNMCNYIPTNRAPISKKEPRRNFYTRPTQSSLRQCSLDNNSD
ncbi:sodium-dependent multivitamin transporter [Trichonephila clavipes]|nr:sodium-dependent multivitamin transporter [Trichonephila clavipes]